MPHRRYALLYRKILRWLVVSAVAPRLPLKLVAQAVPSLQYVGKIFPTYAIVNPILTKGILFAFSVLRLPVTYADNGPRGFSTSPTILKRLGKNLPMPNRFSRKKNVL